MNYAKEINGNYIEVVIPNAYNGVVNVLNGYTNRTDLHVQDGFLELEKPKIADVQKYGNIIKVNEKYVYEVIDLTEEEIAAKQLSNSLASLKVYDTYPDYDLRSQLADYFAKKHSLSGVDEFNGRKLKSVYVNEAQEIVAEKVFSLKNENGVYIELIELFYYDQNNNKIKGFEKGDIIDTTAKQTSIIISCMKQVLKILIDDINLEIEKNIETINNSGASEDWINEKLAEVEVFEIGVNYLFDGLLKTEIDALNRGNSTLLYNRLENLDYDLLNLVAATSLLGKTYRAILRDKFNPDNFKFYTT